MVFLNVIYVLLAIGMIAMILMQRGAGAQAGSGFGGGASSTVFGARGASNFLSKATKWMAVVFFGISLFMAWHATNRATGGAGLQDLGVMSQAVTPPPASGEDVNDNASVPSAPATATPEVPAAAQDSAVPSLPDANPSAEPVENTESVPADSSAN